MGRQAFRRWLTMDPAHEPYDAGASECSVAHRGFAGGAVGDGLVDDRAAIQAAIDSAAQAAIDDASVATAGATVRIPPAMTCRLTAAVVAGVTQTYSLTAASNVNILGSGPSSVLKLDAGASNGTTCDLLRIGTGVAGAVKSVYIDNLTLDGNGTNQTGTSRVILLNGCANVTIGPNVRIINVRTRSIAAANGAKDITVGAVRDRIDARVMGCMGDGNLQSAAAVAGGSNQVTVAGASTAMNGLVFEVEQAGAADALGTGWRNLVGYAKYVSAVRLDMYSDSALTTPLNAGHDASGVRAVIATDDTNRLADCFQVSQGIGGARVYLPHGVYYTGEQALHTSDTLEGDGPGLTFVRTKVGNSTFTGTTEGKLAIRDLCIDGYGPDGGASGATYKSCIYLSNVTNALVENVTLRHCHNGISVRDQLTDDVTLRSVRCEDMLTSNGALGQAASTAGIGVWIFNGPTRVKLDGITVDGCDRHGVYYDPGDAVDPASNQHDFIEHTTGANIQIRNAARCGIGVGFGLQGVRYGSFAAVDIDTVGYRADNASWNLCTGLALDGDQNGEYPQEVTVTGLVMKDIGGIAVSIQGVRCRVEGRVQGFNKAQSSFAVAPIYINSYTGFNTNAVTVQGPDPSYNTVDLEAIYTDALATMYTHACVISGGTSVPDGLGATPGTTRTAQALGNTIRGRFVHQGRKYTDGVTAGTTTFTSASAVFSPDDVGKTILVVGAGTAGGNLFTTIAGRNSATSVVLTAAATDTASGHTFYVGYSGPSTGMLSIGGGTTNCPTEGPNANVCIAYGVADQAASQIEHSAVQTELFSRWKRLASGRMEWGGGAATYDTTLYRNTADVLKTDDSLIVGTDLTVVGKFAANGATPAALPTYSATNVTPDRIYDANATTTDELADILGTLIADLRAMGLLA